VNFVWGAVSEKAGPGGRRSGKKEESPRKARAKKRDKLGRGGSETGKGQERGKSTTTETVTERFVLKKLRGGGQRGARGGRPDFVRNRATYEG